MTPRQLPAEAELEATIMQAAALRGWLVVHFRPAATRNGYRTAFAGHAGFPDLVLARNGTVFAWELKGPAGRPALEQLEWLQHLAGGVTDARIVTPADLDAALAALELGRWPD